jgi:hypothetical protein
MMNREPTHADLIKAFERAMAAAGEIPHWYWAVSRNEGKLDEHHDEAGTIYSYDRTKYRIVPVPEQSSEDKEAFRLVPKED